MRPGRWGGARWYTRSVVFVHAVLFFVAWMLLRRSFQRAIRGGVALKAQRGFGPLLILASILGGSLAVRALSWLWTGGHFVLFVALAGLLAFKLVQLGGEVRSARARLAQVDLAE